MDLLYKFSIILISIFCLITTLAIEIKACTDYEETLIPFEIISQEETDNGIEYSIEFDGKTTDQLVTGYVFGSPRNYDDGTKYMINGWGDQISGVRKFTPRETPCPPPVNTYDNSVENIPPVTNDNPEEFDTSEHSAFSEQSIDADTSQAAAITAEPKTAITRRKTRDDLIFESLMITHIVITENPYVVKIYVRNDSIRFLNDIRLKINNGKHTVQYSVTNRFLFFTYQYRTGKKSSEYVNQDGVRANNVVVISNLKNAEVLDKEYRFVVGIRFFKREYENAEFNLLYKNNIIQKYSENRGAEEAPAAPMLHKGKLTTSWASMKR